MATTDVNVSPLPPQPLPSLGPTGPPLTLVPQSAHSPPPRGFARRQLNSPDDHAINGGVLTHEIPNLRVAVSSEP